MNSDSITLSSYYYITSNQGSNMSTLDLSQSEYFSKTFAGLKLAGTEISDIEFEDCRFEDCDFSDATLRNCRFIECQFIRCNLSLVNLGFSRFNDVLFSESKLVGVNWSNVTWPHFALSAPISFEQCILNDSIFIGLSLSELVMEQCKAHYVDFRDANLSDAKFNHSDFSHAIFGQTNLSNADFSDAVNYDIDLLNNQIKGAKFCRFEAVSLLESLGIELVD